MVDKLIRLCANAQMHEIVKVREEDEELLEDVKIEYDQAYEMVQMYSNILSGMMDAFASIISNNLNMVMKFLASITIILAIPTVVASFWGMNVHVPFGGHPRLLERSGNRGAVRGRLGLPALEEAHAVMAPKGEEARRWQRNDGKKGALGVPREKTRALEADHRPSAVGHRPLLIVVLGDFLFHCFHLGKDWSDSLLVRMIVERRMILPFSGKARAFPAKGEGLFPFSPDAPAFPCPASPVRSGSVTGARLGRRF